MALFNVLAADLSGMAGKQGVLWRAAGDSVQWPLDHLSPPISPRSNPGLRPQVGLACCSLQTWFSIALLLWVGAGV